MRGSGRRVVIACGALCTMVPLLTGCRALALALGIEAPRFELALERESFLTLDPASVVAGRPEATLRLWTRVSNPNDFALTLTRLQGDLFLEERALAEFDLPLGVPLVAAGDTVVPLDVRFGLPSLGSLGALGQALLRGDPVRYRVDGTLGVEAGALGRPTFGPRTWLQGSVDVRAELLQSSRR